MGRAMKAKRICLRELRPPIHSVHFHSIRHKIKYRNHGMNPESPVYTKKWQRKSWGL